VRVRQLLNLCVSYFQTPRRYWIFISCAVRTFILLRTSVIQHTNSFPWRLNSIKFSFRILSLSFWHVLPIQDRGVLVTLTGYISLNFYEIKLSAILYKCARYRDVTGPSLNSTTDCHPWGTTSLARYSSSVNDEVKVTYFIPPNCKLMSKHKLHYR
jgi:hypothetical protein